MGINRIRLQNGATGDPRVDARMQQTYQENIAANQAQQARNEGILQAAASRLFPEGNFQQIRANAPDQTTYNIDATADLVRNNPFGIIGEVAAPALTAAASIPYDVIQGIGRAVDQSNIDTSPYGGIVDDTEIPTGPSLSDLGQAIDAENPLSSALERTIGAATPLAERISGQDYSPNYLETATPTQDNLLPGVTRIKNPNPRFSGDEFFYSVPGVEGELTQATYDQYVNEKTNLASGGRVGFQAGSPLEMAAAQEAKTLDPALDAIRQQLFGKDYIQDIGKGQGIAQYYSGFGLPQSLKFTPPVVEEVAPAVDVTQPVVDTGGGEGGGGGTGDVDIVNTPFEQNLLDEGVGVQGAPGDPVVAPGEMPVTQEEIDAFNQIPVNREYGDEMDIGYGEGQVDPLLAAAVGGVDTTPVEVNENLIDRGNPLNDPRIVSEEFGLVGTPSYIDPIMDPNLMDIRQQQNQEATTLGSKINSAFENVKGKGTEAIGEFKDNLVELGGKVKEGFDNVIEFGDTAIDVGKTLATGAINYLGKSIFGPVGAVLGTALGALDLPGGRSEMSNKLGEQYGMDDIGRLTGGPMAGYAVDSAFGKGIEQTTIDRINSIKNRTAPQTESSEKKIEELEEFLEQIQRNKTAIDYDMEGTDEGDRAAEEAAVADEEFAETGDYDVYAGGGADQDPVGPDFGDTDYADPGVDAEENQPEPSFTPSGGGADRDPAPTPTADFYQDPITTGGGGAQGDKGGKIVCTMMNETYGFGSFRNKIWLRHSKDLAPEYQIGYHKIFLPLVRLSKTNKLLKKTLEHIAVHRTIDIRQEARGKVHLLGRVYRKILEPICYIVGKYGKR